MNAFPAICPSRLAAGAAPLDRPVLPRRRSRVALYSHDTIGIGHMRRNLLIAQALSRAANPPVILLIAGAREINAFGVPEGADYLSLPALHKSSNGDYQPRHLDISLTEMAALRGQSIAAALEAFAPDVLIVDKVPRGAVDELDAGLALLARKGTTRCVLGLRDILDEAPAARREWLASHGDETLRAYYDAIWVYGDATICDPAREYGFTADVAAKVRFTGYLDQRQRSTRVGSLNSEHLAWMDRRDRLALCTVGGGQDGARLAETFAQTNFPAGMSGVLLTGPFMPTETRHRLERHAANNSRLKVLSFVTDAEWFLERAERVVAMGGYNTVCEALSFEKTTLIVPRVHPRREQLIRAERLRDLGLLDVLHPSELSPESLGAWLARELPLRPAARRLLDLDGLTKLPALLNDLLLTPVSFTCPRTDKRYPHVAI
jgi:predicted glycosyltransferase